MAIIDIQTIKARSKGKGLWYSAQVTSIEVINKKVILTTFNKGFEEKILLEDCIVTKAKVL